MIVTLPDDVSEIILLWSVLFLVKQYIASALCFEFMNCILSSIFFSCQTKKRITINVQHALLSTQLSWATTTIIYTLPIKASKETYYIIHISACVSYCNYWKQWTKDLICHNFCLERGIHQDCWLNEPGWRSTTIILKLLLKHAN